MDHTQLGRVLFTEEQIKHRVQTLGKELHAQLPRGEITIVALLNGSVLFVADLIRHLPRSLRLDFIGISSYGQSTTSGDLRYTKQLQLDVRDHHILLVDDILDTGRTLQSAVHDLRKLGARSITTCVLLDKPSRRLTDSNADFVGFQIKDEFVVGYGLDYAERFRNLPYIAVLQSASPK
jgi:hypoxanthine phosphoribosyltransferase